MQDAIIQNALGGEGQIVKITATGTKGSLKVACDSWDVEMAELNNCQIIVRVDWSAVANHLTSLDPHPLTGADLQNPLSKVIDTPIDGVPENVLIADNYWQNISYLKGQAVDGAYNREFTSLSGGYHNSDSLLKCGGGIKSGYYYSLMEGSNRLSTDKPADGDQIINGYSADAALGGAGSRQSLSCANAMWSNVITLDILKNGKSLGTDNTVTPGDTIQLDYTYRIYSGSCTITFYADRDTNPYNSNNLATIATHNLAPARSLIEKASMEWLVTGEAYMSVSGEMATVKDNSATAVPSSQVLLVNGVRNTSISAFNIGNNNFFKLRDMGAAFGFNVDYDATANSVIINSR